MIRRLPEELIRAIAAGEVVENPADVVRELVENALDAGARRVEVELKEGGIGQILVRDDGAGIPREELPLAVERYATSKLSALDRVTTLGFRGEGLFAIRQAGRLRLTSRPRRQLGGATVVADGDVVEVFEHPAPAGTEAEVTRLFARLPARRAGLDDPRTEERRAMAVIYRYLLHRPGVAWRVESDGEERLLHPGGDVLDAVRLVWGPLVANRLLAVDHAREGARLVGVISRPELVRPSRDRLFLAVNGRPVRWPEPLLAALFRAYKELLPQGRFPVGVLNLTWPVEEVVVNLGAKKERVRFLRPEAVAAFLEEAVKAALSGVRLAPEAPGFGPVLPEADLAHHAFPRLRFIGAFRQLYLLAEAGDELWIVDQHAAHERILFEELRRRIREEEPLWLKTPEVLALSAAEADRLEALRPELEALGLVVEPFGPERFLVRRVPAVLALDGAFLPEALKSLLAGEGVEAALRRVLGRLACRPAIKAGHPLSRAGAQALLDALRSTENPWVCPHGRPTALRLSELELARRFGRRGARAAPKEVARPVAEVEADAHVPVAEPRELGGE